MQLLRDLQRVNAAFSGLTGVTIAALNGWLSRQVDLPRPAVAMLGIGLVGWSMMLVVVAVLSAPRLVRASAFVAAGDAAWVIGTVALIALRSPTNPGLLAVIRGVEMVVSGGTATLAVVQPDV